MTGKQKWVLTLASLMVAIDTERIDGSSEYTMIPSSLMYQMAQDRQAELQRRTEEYRRAGRTVPMRIRARIPRFHAGSRRSRAGVFGPSTPGCGKAAVAYRFSRHS